MKGYHYVGLDVRKKTINYCVKKADGEILDQGKFNATSKDLYAFADRLPRPWAGGMEATLFTGWIYDCLLPVADELKVGHSYRLRAICAAESESGGKHYRTPLSKERNKNLQAILIEVAKLAPSRYEPLQEVYNKAVACGDNHNEATILVARKLVAYLLSVDKSGIPFQPREKKD